MVAEDTNGISDVFVRDLARRRTERISVASDGRQAEADPAGWVCIRVVCDDPGAWPLKGPAYGDSGREDSKLIEGDATTAWSRKPSISADGRYVVFQSDAIIVRPDGNHATDTFLRDRVTGTTERVDVSDDEREADGATIDRYATGATVTDDGRFVVFSSTATNLVPGGTNGHEHVFLRDRVLGRTRLVSITTSGEPFDVQCLDPTISRAGRYVGFTAWDARAHRGPVVRDLRSGVTIQVPLGDLIEYEFLFGGFSVDARRVILWSDMGEGANNNVPVYRAHVYVHEFPRFPGQT